MIIQDIGSATSVYNFLSKSSVQRQQALLNSTETSADTVKISDAAKALSTPDNGTTQSRTGIQNGVLKSASEDPQFAEKYAYEMATIPSAMAYDISDSLKSQNYDDIKLSSTGRKIDDAFKEKFYKEAADIDAKRLEIYNTEKAKGTDPVTIIAKMIDFTNSQSREYLEGTGWLDHNQQG